MYRMSSAGLILGAAILATGCTSVDDGFPTYPGPQWEDADGVELSEDVISIHHGDDHCQHDEFDFLHLGWPLGTAADRAGTSARQYGRDGDGELADTAPLYGGEFAAEWQRFDE